MERNHPQYGSALDDALPDQDDTPHAVRNTMVVEETGTDPTRYLVLGPGRAGTLLEAVVMDRPQGPAVIHSMPMQARYRKLLEGRG